MSLEIIIMNNNIILYCRAELEFLAKIYICPMAPIGPRLPYALILIVRARLKISQTIKRIRQGGET